MLGMEQSRDNVTNKSLYQHTDQIRLRETICEHHLVVTGHCIGMPTDEPDNRWSVIYESKIKSYLRPDVRKKTYLNQNSFHILPSGEKTFEKRCR